MTMTEWAADARIPDDVWYASWRRRVGPPGRALQVGGQPISLPAGGDGDDVLVPLMARVMLERSAGDDACTEAHLAAAGFTAAEQTRL
ncbi:MAG TPA: hypothetical protein VJ890_03665, partial [Vineibacter sp.]|nr:hypothetical protein [Vineibacter sp.]